MVMKTDLFKTVKQPNIQNVEKKNTRFFLIQGLYI